MVHEIYVPAARGNYSDATYAKVGGINHWMAGYLPGTDRMFQNPATGYTTNYGIGSRNGKGDVLEVHRYTPTDRHYAFGSYNDDADKRGISLEIENNYWAGYASKPTDDVHELVARFWADKAREHDWRIYGQLGLVVGDFPDHRFYRKAIPAFGRDFNLTTHRSMALKDCPGSTDVQWIADRANQLLSSTASDGFTPITAPKKEALMFTLIADDRGLFKVVTPVGTQRQLTDAAEVRYWSKICANQRGTDTYEAVKVSGEEWESTGLNTF